MNRGTAKRQRLLIYLTVCWLLLWSFIRMLLYPGQLISDSPQAASTGLAVMIATGILALLWAFGGPFLLSSWPNLSQRLEILANSASRNSWIAWSLPALVWFLSFSFLLLAGSLNGSAITGPIIALVLFGAVLLRLLVRSRDLREEQDKPELTGSRDVEIGRYGRLQKAIPDRVGDVLLALLLGFIVLFWFRKAMFDANVTVFGIDLFNLYYMFEGFVSEAWRSGQIPLWNPYIFSGSPVLGHPQSLVFYPPQLLLRLLPLNLSITWAIALHVWIAGIGMFALARWKGISSWISFLCAMVYMLNSGLLLRILAGHVWLVYALSWLPLAWLFLMMAMRSGRLIFIIAAAIFTSMIILTGHPTFPIYILLFFGFYWIWACYEEWKASRSWHAVAVITGRFLGVMLLAFGLSAVQLVPTAVLYGQVSLTQGYGAGSADFLALSVSDLMAFVVPGLYFTAEKRRLYWEMVPYMGVLTMMLLPFSYAVKRYSWFRNFLSMSALLSLAIALGSSIGIYFVLFTAFPPFRLARIPPRSLVTLIPAIILLGGMGLQNIYERAVSVRVFSLLIRVYFFFAAFVLGIASASWLNDRQLVSIQLSDGALLLAQLLVGGLLIVLVHAVLAGRLSSRSERFTHIVLALVLLFLGTLFGIFVAPVSLFVAGQLAILSLLVVVFSVLLTRIYHHSAGQIAVLVLIAVTFIDLFVSGRSHVKVEQPPVFYQDERLMLENVDLQQFDRVLSTVGQPDQYMLDRVSNIDGYNSGILSGYDYFLRGVSEAQYFSSTRILLNRSTVDPRALEFLGVKYIIVSEPLDGETFEQLAIKDSIYLYENRSLLPRAFVVYETRNAPTDEDALKILNDKEFDYSSQVVLNDAGGLSPGKTGEASVSIVEYSEADGNMLLRVETTEPGILVLSEPYYSERRAWLNGEETDVLRANTGFIGIAIPAGAHDVELRYVPTSLYIGGAITALAIFIALGAFAYSWVSGYGHRAGRR